MVFPCFPGGFFRLHYCNWLRHPRTGLNQLSGGWPTCRERRLSNYLKPTLKARHDLQSPDLESILRMLHVCVYFCLGAPYVARADGGFVAGNAVTQLAESSIPPPSPSVVTAKSSDCELVPPIQSKEDLTLDYMGCGNSGFPSGMTPSPQPNSRKPKSPLPAPNDPSSGTPGSKEAIVPKEAVPEHPIAPMSKETTSSAQPAAALPATPPPPPQLPDEGATAFLDVASYSACAYMHLKVTPVYRIQGSGGM